MFYITFLSTLSLFLIVLSLVLRYNRSVRLIEKIPGPKRWPIVGSGLTVLRSKSELFKFLRFMFATYGDLVALWFFHKRGVLIYSPEGAEVILSSVKFNEKQEPYDLLKSWLCEGLLTSNGSKWLHRRKLLTPAFHFNILRQFAQSFNAKTETFLEEIKKETDKEETNIAPFISEMTLKTMCETSMGTTIHENLQTKRSRYFQAVNRLSNCVVFRLPRLWYHVEWIYRLTPYGRTYKTALDDLHSFTDEIITERRSRKIDAQKIIANFNEDDVYGKKTTLAMLDLLLDNELQGKIDNDGIREEVDTFMFEGHDTTATVLLFMIVRLANEPEIQSKMYEELVKIFGDSDRAPSTKDLAEMKYVECCVKESLRLYPSVPFIARKINEDVVLNGYTVPAGINCAIQIFDIHRRADIYPDPERFIPERFLPENANKLHPYAYIPFSAGPRNCIGQKFAMMELKTVISGLLRRFKLEPVTRTEEIQFTTGLVLRPLHPLYVRLRNRKE